MRTRLPIVFTLLAIIGTACSAAAPPAVAPSIPAPSTTPQSTAAASAQTAPEPASIALAQSSLERAPSTDADAVAAGAAINSFGTDLYRALAATDENIVFSPTSIAFALGMVRPGAGGQTAEEMDAVLHEVASDDHAAWLNGLDLALAKRTGAFPDIANEEVDVALRIANTAFAQEGFPLEDAYLDALASRFAAGLGLLDFAADPEAARLAINEWVAGETEERITELLRPPDIREATRLVLVNAIYLKAAWHQAFPDFLTEDAPFTTRDGTTVRVPTMMAKIRTTCGGGDGWRSIELPYAGEALTMTIVVPDDLDGFEAQLDAERLAAIFAASQEPCYYRLTLPRFEVETRADMTEMLSALGMPTAFGSGADFSGITTAERLHIGKVIHQADMSVNEKGTEAAAATAVGVDLSRGPAPFQVNRPFIFVVRDRETGAVLFLGRITDPSIGS